MADLPAGLVLFYWDAGGAVPDGFSKLTDPIVSAQTLLGAVKSDGLADTGGYDVSAHKHAAASTHGHESADHEHALQDLPQLDSELGVGSGMGGGYNVPHSHTISEVLSGADASASVAAEARTKSDAEDGTPAAADVILMEVTTATEIPADAGFLAATDTFEGADTLPNYEGAFLRPKATATLLGSAITPASHVHSEVLDHAGTHVSLQHTHASVPAASDTDSSGGYDGDVPPPPFDQHSPDHTHTLSSFSVTDATPALSLTTYEYTTPGSVLNAATVERLRLRLFKAAGALALAGGEIGLWPRGTEVPEGWTEYDLTEAETTHPYLEITYEETVGLVVATVDESATQKGTHYHDGAVHAHAVSYEVDESLGYSRTDSGMSSCGLVADEHGTPQEVDTLDSDSFLTEIVVNEALSKYDDGSVIHDTWEPEWYGFVLIVKDVVPPSAAETGTESRTLTLT